MPKSTFAVILLSIAAPAKGQEKAIIALRPNPHKEFYMPEEEMGNEIGIENANARDSGSTSEVLLQLRDALTTLGRLQLAMPFMEGDNVLDVIHADQSDFEVDFNDLRAVVVDSGVAGGVRTFQVRTSESVNLIQASPPNHSSLSRSRRNFIRLTFDGPIVAPTAEQIQIRELLPAPDCDGPGLFGPNLSSGFIFRNYLKMIIARGGGTRAGHTPV
ncbi:MAG: hypothetical protein HY287_08420 [Planctomycetes bacterium]|nr:hypothetical protein [Planctomycetota bacterium]